MNPPLPLTRRADMHRGVCGAMFNHALIVCLALGLLLSAPGRVMANPAVIEMETDSQHQLFYGKPIARVAIGSADIADVTVIEENQLLITPQQPGSTSLRIWPRGSDRADEYELLVNRSARAGQDSLRQLNITQLQAQSAGPELQIRGEAQQLEDLADVRAVLGFDDGGIDRSTVDFDAQVQIDIKIVEVNRDRLQSAGFFLGKNGGRTRALGPPGLLSGVTGGSEGFALESATGFLPRREAFNFVYGRASQGLLGVVSLLEGNGFAYTLAEPSLLAMSGQSASFLAGGEFPVPVRGGLDNSVTIQYKEFGVRLSLTPTVLDRNRIALKVAPEVSELDFNAGVQTGGVTVPALRVRRTDTSVALGDGESFVISGLISQNTLASVDKLPGLGDLPIIGAFFRSSQLDRNDRELLMIVTPHLVRPLARDAQLPELPGEDYRDYAPGYAEFMLLENGSFQNSPAVPSGFSK